MIVVNVILFFITIEKAFCVGGLKYYETLSTIHVSKRIRRNANKEEIINNLSFKMFDRDFDLTLTAGTSVLAKDFRAQLAHGDGSVTPHQFDQSKLFSGHETGKPDVSVHACIDNTLWVITIFDVNETYAVEPAYYLLNASENPKNDTMIAYRSSDFVDDEPQCGAKDSSNILRQHSSAKYGFMDGSKNRTTIGVYVYVTHFSVCILMIDFQAFTINCFPDSHPKHKRSLDNHHCHMMLVGDYDFYSKRCNKNHVACMTIMVHFLSVADSIFKTSTFEDDNTFTNIGLKIGMLLLLTSYSDDQSPDSFNRQGQKWDSETKLTVNLANHLADELEILYFMTSAYEGMMLRRSHQIA
ncbi:uncharacterized protein LOC131932823 [Physella acuta]|uniref:uncharacterized protein LOC131932823 n=1 Tax=Physella acuta TaxID=109671 RepID=UPI0027DBDBAD|nr:uncharacterized protein LOC131932823 [Physella acuta]